MFERCKRILGAVSVAFVFQSVSGCGEDPAPKTLTVAVEGLCPDSQPVNCNCPDGSKSTQACVAGLLEPCACLAHTDAFDGDAAASADSGSRRGASDSDAATTTPPDAAGPDGTVVDSGLDAKAGSCQSDKECKSAGKVCDPLTATCVACLSDAECGASQHCASLICQPFTPCSNSIGCKTAKGPDGKDQPICDPKIGECSACLGAADCPPSNDCKLKQCTPFKTCQNSTECGTDQVCDKSTNRCVDCLTDSDCGANKLCEVGVCHSFVPCSSDKQCTPLGMLCDSTKGKCGQCLQNTDCPVIYNCQKIGVASTGLCILDVCAQGQGVCSNNAKATCNTVGDSYGSPQFCPSQTTCVAAGGKPECKAWACTPGSACQGDKAVECNSDGLEVAKSTDCAASGQKCVAGACKTQVCTPSIAYCDGNMVKLCDKDGLGGTTMKPCGDKEFCEAGACKPQICTPNQPTCVGNLLATCNSNGSGYVSGGSDCGATAKCSAGACKPIVCTAGQPYCDSQTIKQCDAEGVSSAAVKTCGASEFCDAGVCKAQTCSSGKPVCDGNSAKVCNATGSGYVDAGKDCTPLKCLSGVCKAQVCSPASQFCEGAKLKTCSVDGVSVSAEQICPNGTFCGMSKVGDAGCQPNVCDPGKAACSGTLATTCKADGSGYDAAGVECKVQGKVCTGGLCKALVCDPLVAGYCDGPTAMQCDATGMSPSVIQACGAGTYCEKGACLQQICEPNKQGCSANKPATCNANGGGYSSVGADCGSGKSCAGGVCKAQVDCSAIEFTAGQVPTLTSALAYPAAWTVEGWARLPSLPTQWGALIGVDATEACSGMSNHWYVQIDPDGTITGWTAGTGAPSSTKVSKNTWFHFALQYHGDGAGSLYVDGVLVRSVTAAQGTWPTKCPMRLGNTQGSSSHYLSAQVGSLRYSNGVRYTTGFAPAKAFTSDAQTTWLISFDEGAGATASDAATQAKWSLGGAAWIPTGPACEQSVVCDPPSSLYCDGNTVKQCGAYGYSAKVVQTCSNSQYCDKGACAAQICEPSKQGCSGNKPATCNANGSGYVNVGADCGSGKSCAGGVCKAQICAPNTITCASTGYSDAVQCDSLGLTSAMYGTCGAGYFCTPFKDKHPCDTACGAKTAQGCWCDANCLKTGDCCGAVVAAPDATKPIIDCAGSTCGSCNKGITSTVACSAQVCSPGNSGCDGSVAATCNSSGSGYLAGGVDCKLAGKMCLAGGCTACTPSLAPKVDYPLTGGGDGKFVVIADVNGDGKPDMVASNDSAAVLSVYINAGGAEFATKVDYPAPASGRFLAVGDLNDDGKPDIALACFSGKLSIFLNQGNGTFPGHTEYNMTGGLGYDVTIADFNGDGAKDVATAVEDAAAANVFLNKGNGSFAPAVAYPAVADTDGIASGDLNGDGKPDIVLSNVINISGKVSVLINKGNGTFATKVDYAVGNQPLALAMGDVNGDGKLDLVVANRAGNNVSVLMGNGDGTLAAKVDYPTGKNPQERIAVADMNGDGKLDIVTPNVADSTVSILKNLGNGSFAAKVDYPVGALPYGLAVGDFNADGLVDIATANSGSNNLSVLMSGCAVPSATASSCKAAVIASPAAVDGLYSIDPDGAGPIPAATLFCDMKNGGLTLVANIYDSPGDDAPNSTDYVVTGWKQAASGAWTTAEIKVDRDATGTGSAAVSLAFVAALKASGGQQSLKMCFVHQTGADTVCRTSADASLTLVSNEVGNAKLTALAADKLTYTFGRLAGLAGSTDGYDWTKYKHVSNCVPRTVGSPNEFGNDASKGLCENSDGQSNGTWVGVWHAFGSGVSYQPWKNNSVELGNGSGPDPSVTSYGFRLYVGP